MNPRTRVRAVARHVEPAPAAADTPDVGAPAEVYDKARMHNEAGAFVFRSMTPAGACRPLLSPPSDWGTVTRGNPPGHLVPKDELAAAGLTESTWSLVVDADSRIDPPHVRSPTEIANPLKLDMADLMAIGRKHGTVKVMKAMQCLNVDSPLGQGVWEGVPLATVLRQCGAISNCRRVFYWGFHNNDDRQVASSSSV